jgi:membrane-bound lytic murein transglycosylase A
VKFTLSSKNIAAILLTATIAACAIKKDTKHEPEPPAPEAIEQTERADQPIEPVAPTAEIEEKSLKTPQSKTEDSKPPKEQTKKEGGREQALFAEDKEYLTQFGITSIEHLRLASWDDVSGWQTDKTSEAWPAFIQSCNALKKKLRWEKYCAIAFDTKEPSDAFVKSFFEKNFHVYQSRQSDGSQDGMITGYYEPLLNGSLTQSRKYPYPLYAPPNDLIKLDPDKNPDFARFRGRVRKENGKFTPYYTRSEIENGTAPMKGKEIAWVDNDVERFFLQIQGSGRIQLESGEVIRVGFADTNGHAYKSIGKILVDRGELKLSNASMQGIKAWAAANPKKLRPLLNENPSYVFFKIMPNTGEGPRGSLGVPISPRRSIAVDDRYVPLGSPVFISTTWPNSADSLSRLMMAQDKGGAIKGPVRADFFWGFGEDAAIFAGKMKQPLRVWVLIPNP